VKWARPTPAGESGCFMLMGYFPLKNYHLSFFHFLVFQFLGKISYWAQINILRNIKDFYAAGKFWINKFRILVAFFCNFEDFSVLFWLNLIQRLNLI
jgi:hypothetical protein